LKLRLKFLLIPCLALVLACNHAFGACAVTINTFPYAEDFEAGAGNWTTGGVNNDWVRGAPSKPIINAAGSGTNCWITGGLSVSFYQFGERSWVESPCFDFSSLDFPVVSFQIFWETENQYDGGNFQYSLNGGMTWINVGTNNEPTDCFTQNWFNQISVTNLNSFVTVNRGWSGTSLATSGNCIGGNGSGGWKLARHCLKNLAHEPQVQFRFTFGAGTTCNDFDGLAFDDFRIEEAAPSFSSFSFACTSASDVSFTDGSNTCPQTWNWIFGDGSTGSATNPIHTYSQPGVYEVKLITGNSCSASDTSSRFITIMNASVTSTDESCAGVSDGTATVTVNPAGAYSYSWSTVPVQSGSTATNLTAGTYTVTVSGANACTLTQTVQVQLVNINFSATTNSTETSCAGVNDGMAMLNVSNASLYSYAWNTVPVQTTDTAFNLAPGSYNVTVNGPGLCVPATFTADVTEGSGGTPENFLGSDTSTCSGNTIILHAGNFNSYVWDDGSDSSFRFVSQPGTYFVLVTTSAGCTGTDSIYVEEKCLDDVVFPNSFTPNEDGRNDVFKAYGIGVKSFLMQLYNRWGEKIFESDSIDHGWDGTYLRHLVQDGIYTCIVKYSMDGINIREKKGMVVLMRGIN
jgi:gliding motility-associated-like protein